MVANPTVILVGAGLAARHLLQSTAAVLGEFPGIRVEHVNKLTPLVSKGEWPSDRTAIGIIAASTASAVRNAQKLMGNAPLIVVPMAKNPAQGRKMLEISTRTGVPTVALNEAGARNAALLAVSVFAAIGVAKLRTAFDAFRARQTASVLKMRLPAA